MEKYYDVLIISFGVWLLLLTLLVIWILISAQRLMKNVKMGNLVKILDKVIRTEMTNTKSVRDLESSIRKQAEENLMDVQKMGLVRFNPFEETGGDHSFSLTLLDGYDSGVVITSLHTRQGTRTYLKEIVKGRSSISLSKEERKALTIAQSKRK